MLKADDVAKYFLSKDKDRVIFNNNIVEKNNRKSYEGNIRLNKYLFLSQVVYMAKYGKRLFKDNFVANFTILLILFSNTPQIGFTQLRQDFIL